MSEVTTNAPDTTPDTGSEASESVSSSAPSGGSSTGGFADSVASVADEALGAKESSSKPQAKPKADSDDGAKEKSSSDAETKDGGADTRAAKENAALKEEIRKLKLKVNGEEREYSESEVIRKAQLAESADQRFQEAAEMRKQAEQLVTALKENPLAVLTHESLGINFRELAEQYLSGELEREMMTPEQRELMELREFREQQMTQQQMLEQQRQEEAQQRAIQEAQATARKEYDQKISAVLNEAGLPKTPATVKRIAEQLRIALDHGYELDVPTAVDRVRESYLGDVKSLFGEMDAEGLISTFGEDLVHKIRRYDLARIRAKRQPQQESPADIAEQSTEGNVRRRSKPSEEALDPHSWLERVRQKAFKGQ